jgi:hypothetical protein
MVMEEEMLKRWGLRLGLWLVKRCAVTTYGIWMPVPEGFDPVMVEKKPASSGVADPLDLWHTVGIKLVKAGVR